jgi:hypothetical protein
MLLRIRASPWSGIHLSMLLRITPSTWSGIHPSMLLRIRYLRIVNGYHQIVLTDDEQIDPLILFGRTRGALRLNSRTGKH